MDIALLEDEPSDAKLISLFLESSGYKCSVFDTGNSLMEALPNSNFSLIIIDWELPDISGDIILEWIRREIGWELPVIFVTGHDSIEDIVAMLEAGADDYMTKPVNLKEMLARISALIRRSQDTNSNKDIIEMAPYIMDFSRHKLTMSGSEINLTPKEFELTGYLLRNIGQLIARDQLLQEVWGYGPEVHTRTIDIHVSRIRKKLSLTEENGWKLTSIYHEGYRLDRVEVANSSSH